MSSTRVTAAWLLFLTTVLLAVVEVVFVVLAGEPPLSPGNMEEGFPLVTMAAVAASAVGALIVTRYPAHRIGWLFLVGQLGTMVGLSTQAYGHDAMTGGWGSNYSGQLSLWVSVQTGGAFALALVGLLLLLAPDGHLLSRRWSWGVGITGLGLVLHVAAVSTVSPRELDADAHIAEPSLVVTVLELAAVVAIGVGLVAGAVSLFIRLRGAEGDERAQLRWICAAAAALAISVPVNVVLELLVRTPAWLAILPVMVAYLVLPLCTGVAILRFRLYDIDVILNRSIVLTVITGLVAAAYIALVVIFSEANVAGDENSSWPALLATALVALAFQPMRRRVNRLSDRLVYGAQAAPYEALAQFSDELRRSGHLAEMLPRVAEAVGRAVGARHAEVWLDTPGQEAMRATWQDRAASGDDVVVPVTDQGETLGGLRITMPPARGLRPSEGRLLDDFAAQLAGAFRSSRLESELAAQVSLLARQGEALERSSERLISAESAERARFESAIAREVLPYLTPMPVELTQLHEATARSQPWPREAIDALVARTNTALESLRTLTRGVFPAELAHRGLASALTTHVRLTGVPNALEVDESLRRRRFDARIETIAYFCAVELVRSLSQPLHLTLSADADRLTLDARGGAAGSEDLGTDRMVDRVESVGGTLRVHRFDDTVHAEVQLPTVVSPDLLPGPLQQAGFKG